MRRYPIIALQTLVVEYHKWRRFSPNMTRGYAFRLALQDARWSWKYGYPLPF
jgi:hypothetical protein